MLASLTLYSTSVGKAPWTDGPDHVSNWATGRITNHEASSYQETLKCVRSVRNLTKNYGDSAFIVLPQTMINSQQLKSSDFWKLLGIIVATWKGLASDDGLLGVRSFSDWYSFLIWYEYDRKKIEQIDKQTRTEYKMPFRTAHKKGVIVGLYFGKLSRLRIRE